MNYHFKLHKEENGFWAECIEIPSCRTQGDSLSDLKSNASEALSLHLSVLKDSKIEIPGPIHLEAQPDIILISI